MISIFHTSVMRNLRKGKFHLILNIAGLALGLAAFLYIATYIFYEISYDRFHTKSDRIYRCVAFLKLGDVATNFAKSEIPLAQAALNDLPEVEEATRLVQLGNTIVRQNDQKFIEDEAWYADANIFKVFDFKLLIGDENSALSKPNSIVLTEEAAIKYFGSVNPIGKSLGIGENNSPYQVTGILDKIPENSHLQFEMLASFSSFLENRKGDLWGDFTATYTYLLIKEGTDMNRFYPKFKIFPEKYWGPMIENSLGKTLKEFEKSGNYLRYELQPLSKVHLNTTFSEELKNHGNYRILLILGITGLFILIIACFNFINLSTAQASLRAKEIGLKKIIGSLRNQLISQLLFETFIYSLIALVLAVGFLFIFIPLLNSFSGINMPNSYILNRFTLLTVATVPFIVTFLAGSYPAFYLTRFQPGEVINRKICMGKTKSNLRGGLVTFQFVVFIILIFSTVVIRKQLFFLQHQNPGFNKENVLVVKNTSRLNNSRLAYKNTLLDNTHIISGSFASKLPSVDDNRTNLFCQKGSQEKFLMNRLYVDLDFENTLNTKMVVGRFFSDQLTTETNYAIINEEAARLLGWSDCNDKILYDFNNGGRDFKVIGIMKNFHLRSMREKPAPVVIRLSDQE
ncbi:MAG TPA: ABC transporter permease [Prolixibacteraceae bacterium]|nr:ABC transporter permease [Prolixibacteraceae bacterium]